VIAFPYFGKPGDSKLLRLAAVSNFYLFASLCEEVADSI
jgi:hypothetical protein